MLIDVSELLTKPIGEERNLEIKEKIDAEDIIFLSPISGNVTLMGTDAGVLATFSIRAKIKLVCARCLDEFEKAVNLNFSQEYIENSKDEAECRISTKGEIDITESIRQEILLEIGVGELCRKDCKGLCPECGVNWNHKKCKHFKKR